MLPFVLVPASHAQVPPTDPYLRTERREVATPASSPPLALRFCASSMTVVAERRLGEGEPHWLVGLGGLQLESLAKLTRIRAMSSGIDRNGE